MKRTIVLLFALVALLAVSAPAAAERIPGADHGGRPLEASLTGAAEVPAPGDSDGTGLAHLTLNQGQREICFEITVENITLPATAAHIHSGSAEVAGDVVVTLAPPDEDGTANGCISDVDRALIRDIRQHPDAYYVNVHNADFPGGAVRGQLSR